MYQMVRTMRKKTRALLPIPLFLLFFLAPGAARAEGFLKAKPVWPAGRSLEKNLQVLFRSVVDVENPRGVILRLTASTLYRAWVNGRHAGYGPARGPHGYYRIDELDISSLLKRGKNIVAIEVAGYNVNSYYTLDQPSFLQAEVIRGKRVLAATGESGFEAAIDPERIQKVQRYSFQRPFSEAYRIRGDHGRWRNDLKASFATLPCEVDRRPLRYLPRIAPYPDLTLRPVVAVAASGKVAPKEKPGRIWKDRSLTGIGPRLKGYPERELEVIPSIELQKYSSRLAPPAASVPFQGPLELEEREFRILDLGINRTGFIGITVSSRRPSRLVLAFDEVLHEGDVDFKRLGCVNLITYSLPAGRLSLESFEPYTLRYLKAIVLEGECALEDVHLRDYGNPNIRKGTFRASDPRLGRLFEAGRETFRQNALDTFLDCPSRERAGWLCDSFFTARVAPDLGGDIAVERAMMENFLLPEKFEFLPEGMLPMCYPADHNDGVFIPNWAMWFVVQLEEYLARSGDRTTVDRLKDRVMALWSYLGRFRNSDGLLERLPGWVFVEWSDANKYVQDVNYPSNMLYAGMLDGIGNLYGEGRAREEAGKVREAIRSQSFDGTFFVDNAVRRGGELSVTRNRTEVCQYFAFFFRVATPGSHPRLWSTLLRKFGPRRRSVNPFPRVGMANSFIGNMLRIELLSREGHSQQILDESIDYLLYMADRTGTLWENVGDTASCNHGFASHIVHTLYRDILGVRELSRVEKKLRLRFSPLSLDWCEGAIPTADGPLEISWRKSGDTLEYSCLTPEGYSVEVENRSGLELRKNKGLKMER